MTESTKLLFRLIRFRLALGLSATFFVFLLIARTAPSLDPVYMLELPFAGLAMALVTGWHPILRGTMFPVTDRQSAWIPMAAWGLGSLAGAAGLVAGQAYALGFGMVSLHSAVLYWVAGVRILPVVCFVLLMLWRGMRYYPGFVGFLGFLPMVFLSAGKRGEGLDVTLQSFSAWWPLWAMGSIFLIWEAPRQAAVLRGLDYIESKNSLIMFRIPQLSGPMRPTWPTRAANAALYLVLLVILIYILRVMLFMPIEQYRKNPGLLGFLIFFFIPFSYILHCWRLNRASGLGLLRSFAVLTMEMTGIGYALNDKMGVKRGMAARCRFCGGWRFDWQAECSHCGDRRVVASEDRTGAQQAGLGAVVWPRHDKGAMMFRGMIPVYVLSAILLFNWTRWFGS